MINADVYAPSLYELVYLQHLYEPEIMCLHGQSNFSQFRFLPISTPSVQDCHKLDNTVHQLTLALQGAGIHSYGSALMNNSFCMMAATR